MITAINHPNVGKNKAEGRKFSFLQISTFALRPIRVNSEGKCRDSTLLTRNVSEPIRPDTEAYQAYISGMDEAKSPVLLRFRSEMRTHD